jgi:hypothetical protein
VAAAVMAAVMPRWMSPVNPQPLRAARHAGTGGRTPTSSLGCRTCGGQRCASFWIEVDLPWMLRPVLGMRRRCDVGRIARHVVRVAWGGAGAR